MPLLKILLIVLLIILPFGEILRFNFGNYIYVKPLEVISVITALWTAVLYIKNKAYRKSLRLYFFYFPLIGFISLVVNSYWLKPTELITAFLYLLRWVSYVGVFFAVVQLDEKFRIKVFRFLLADGIIFLVIGYMQYFFYQHLQNLFYLGWDNHAYRLVSSFLDPNYAGAFLVLYMIVIAVIFFDKNDKKNKRKTVTCGLLLALTLAAVFLTYSRSALIMLIASGIVFFLLINKKKFILYLIGIIISFIIIISPFFYIVNLDLFRVYSGMARLGDIQNALQIIATNPLLGVGFNAYRYAQLKHHFVQNVLSIPSNAGSGVDTSILFILGTTGIIGLLAYAYLCFKLFKKAKSTQNRFSLIFLVSGTGLIVSSLFNNTLFYSEIMFWMWMIAGLMYERM